MVQPERREHRIYLLSADSRVSKRCSMCTVYLRSTQQHMGQCALTKTDSMLTWTGFVLMTGSAAPAWCAAGCSYDAVLVSLDSIAAGVSSFGGLCASTSVALLDAALDAGAV